MRLGAIAEAFED